MRPDQRLNHAIRPVSLVRNFTKFAEGSVLASFGETKVLCTATIEEQVPAFIRDSGKGWVTAEYAMLPRCTQTRIVRDAVKKGRALEISRFVGRCLRCITDLTALGERQIIIDCDVLQADGGTRTASVTGAYVAIHDALNTLVTRGLLPKVPLLGMCAAISVGIIDNDVRVDLCYEEDSKADVDMNLVMDNTGRIIEIQGSSEGKAFPRPLLNTMLDMGQKAIEELMAIQTKALSGE